MIGLSTMGSISFGCALVAGRKRVPSPAAGKTALRTLAGINSSLVQRRAFGNRSIVFPTPLCYVLVPGKKTPMAYVIAEPCIGTKDTACVDACPVDCIHPKKDEPAYADAELLYIDPVECIDCGACVPVCPVSAIFALDDLPEKWSEFTAKNAADNGKWSPSGSRTGCLTGSKKHPTLVPLHPTVRGRWRLPCRFPRA